MIRVDPVVNLPVLLGEHLEPIDGIGGQEREAVLDHLGLSDQVVVVILERQAL